MALTLGGAGEALAAVVIVTPDQSLARVAAAHPPGTVFQLTPGTFQTGAVLLETDDKVLGSGQDATFVRFSGTMGFNTTDALGVEIAFVDISGVRGTKRTCGKECGRGIHRGENAYYHDLRSHHNTAMGIGGGLNGATIVNVELDHNGSVANFGCCAAGIKSGRPFSITDSYVHDNTGNGIWCDMVCWAPGTMTVARNTVVNHDLDGIHMEWTQGGEAMITDNYVRNSGRHGIHIAQFSYARVINNDVDGSARYGIAFVSARRGPAGGLSQGNKADGIKGCGLPRVTCL